MYIDTDTRTPKIHRDALSEFLNLLTFEIKSVGIWHSDCDAKANYTADDIEFVYYLKGGSNSTIDGNTYCCGVKDLMILPPNSLTTSVNEGYSEYEYFYIHFNVKPYHLEERFVQAILRKGHVLHVEDDSAIEHIYASILEESRLKQDGYRSVISGLLSNLCVMLIRRAGVQELSHNRHTLSDTALLSNVTKRISSSLDCELSVSALAEEFHVSESYLYKSFKKHFHVSPTQYIQKKKLEFAYRALSSGDYTVSEVAEMTGFSSVSAFTHFFINRTGKKPSDILRSEVTILHK